MLPDGWEHRAVRDMGLVQAGRQRSPSFDKGTLRPYLRVANVFDGRIDTSDLNRMVFTDDEFFRYRLEPGEILLNEGQSLDLVGRPAMYRGTPEDCCFQNTLIRFRPSNEVHPDFALKRFQQCLYDGTFQSIAKKTTSIAHLGVSRFGDLVLPWPPLCEQKAIVQILATWDEAISASERLLANCRSQRKKLSNELLRFPVPRGSERYRFDTFALGDVFERVTRKNTIGNTNVLTISGQQGLVAQRGYFKKRVASANLNGYTLLEKGEFAYNKSHSAGYPMGAIKPLIFHDRGVVSSLYLCFRFRSDAAGNGDFFRHYFEAGLLNEEISGIAQEGARSHGLLNVGVKEFFSLKIRIPALADQKWIAGVLNLSEQDELLIERQLGALNRERHVLMKDLLTGKRRVRIPGSTFTTSAA